MNCTLMKLTFYFTQYRDVMPNGIYGFVLIRTKIFIIIHNS